MSFNLPFGVRVADNSPLDADRYIALTVVQRDALVTGGRAYDGLQVYVVADQTLYILKGTTNADWEASGSGSGLQNFQQVTGQGNTTTDDVIIEGNLEVKTTGEGNPFGAKLNLNSGVITDTANNFPFYNAINKRNATNASSLVYGISNLIEHDGDGDISQLRGVFNRVRSDGTGTPQEMVSFLNEASYRNMGTGTVPLVSASENFVVIEESGSAGTITSALGVRGKVEMDSASETVGQAIGGIFELELLQGTVNTFVGISIDVAQSAGTTIGGGSFLELAPGIDIAQAQANGVKAINSFIDLPSQFVGEILMDKSPAQIDAEASGLILVNRAWIEDQGFSTGGGGTSFAGISESGLLTDDTWELTIGGDGLSGTNLASIYLDKSTGDIQITSDDNGVGNNELSIDFGSGSMSISGASLEVSSEDISIENNLGDGLQASDGNATRLLGSNGIQVEIGVGGVATTPSINDYLGAIDTQGNLGWITPTGGSSDGVVSNVVFDSLTKELQFTGSNGGFNSNLDVSELVFKVNTPVDNQVGVWTGDGNLEGNSNFTYTGQKLKLTGGFINSSAPAHFEANSTGIDSRVGYNMSRGTEASYGDRWSIAMLGQSVGEGALSISTEFNGGSGASQALLINRDTFSLNTPNLTTAIIDAEQDKTLVTKEWTQANLNSNYVPYNGAGFDINLNTRDINMTTGRIDVESGDFRGTLYRFGTIAKGAGSFNTLATQFDRLVFTGNAGAGAQVSLLFPQITGGNIDINIPTTGGTLKVADTGSTVSGLPASPTVGDTAYVTDALAPTYLGVLTGGGTVTCPAFYDGTNWVAH